MRRAALSLAFLVACSTPGPPSAPGDAPTSTARPSEPAPSAVAQGASAPSASAAAGSNTPTTPASSAVAHPSVGAACAADADCRWDDPCAPQRCVGGRAEPVACTESFPPPGACLCVEHQCTLKPKRMPAPSGACEPGGCVVDRAAGVCIADTRAVPPDQRISPGQTGPSCDCVTPAMKCEMTWLERAPCKSVRDCWVTGTSRRYPIARPARFKGRDFKICVDGAAEPACGSDGFCTIGRVAGC